MEEAEVKEKEEAASQRRELFNDRRGKQAELRQLERKIEMAELVSTSKSIQAKHFQLLLNEYFVMIKGIIEELSASVSDDFQ